MKPSSTLQAVLLAGTVAFTGTACKPTQDKHKEEVKRIIAEVQPTKDIVSSSEDYYFNDRKDLPNISDKQRESLALGHAKMTCLARGLENGTISVADFNTIIASDDRIITDKNTQLQVDKKGGIWYFSSASVNKKNIEFSTADGTPNIILENYAVSKVEMKGGELRVSISWDLYETEVTDNTAKQKVSANFSPKDGKKPGTWTIILRLMLAK